MDCIDQMDEDQLRKEFRQLLEKFETIKTLIDARVIGALVKDRGYADQVEHAVATVPYIRKYDADRETWELKAKVLASARGMVPKKKTNRILVAEIFGAGATSAVKICALLGLDPRGNQASYDEMMSAITPF